MIVPDVINNCGTGSANMRRGDRSIQGVLFIALCHKQDFDNGIKCAFGTKCTFHIWYQMCIWYQMLGQFSVK
jgi:hypothetical protein